MVRRRHHISIAVLVVLTGLPVLGTACAMQCEMPTAPASHESGTDCDHGVGVTAGMRFDASATHDCTHETAVVASAATLPTRADKLPLPIPLVITLDAMAWAVSDFDVASAGVAQRGRQPAPAAPPILRI